MQITQRKTADLIPYVNNARTHSEQQVLQIAASIKEFGFNSPVLVDGENGIIAGHGRVLAAKKLNLDEVPTIELKHLTKTQKKAYILADNRLALNSGWDNDLLALELGELSDDGFDLDLLGFDDTELSLLDNTEQTEGLTDEDAVPELPIEPVTKLGDVWLCGNHRVMCGDSTSIDAVEKLMDGLKVDTVYTDPPYGINEKGDRSKRTGAAEGTKYEDFADDTNQYAIDAYNLCEGLNIPRQVWWGLITIAIHFHYQIIGLFGISELKKIKRTHSLIVNLHGLNLSGLLLEFLGIYGKGCAKHPNMGNIEFTQHKSQ
jgi:hypothetical protein